MKLPKLTILSHASTFLPMFFLLTGIPCPPERLLHMLQYSVQSPSLWGSLPPLPFSVIPGSSLPSFTLFKQSWLFSSQCHTCILYITSIVRLITPLHLFFLKLSPFFDLLEGNDGIFISLKLTLTCT